MNQINAFMKLRLWFIPMLFASFFLVSATSTSTVYSEPAAQLQPSTPGLPTIGASVKKTKLNFIERLLLKFAIKRVLNEEGDLTKANKQASTSLSFGIVAVSLLLLGLFLPYIMLGAIPAGIVALTTGGTALKEGTTERSKARTGRALGIATLATVGAIFLLALLLIAAFSGWN